jgi:hypothetical protein
MKTDAADKMNPEQKARTAVASFETPLSGSPVEYERHYQHEQDEKRQRRAVPHVFRAGI